MMSNCKIQQKSKGTTLSIGIIKNYYLLTLSSTVKDLRVHPMCNLVSQLATAQWVLGKVMRCLDQRQRVFYDSQQ